MWVLVKQLKFKKKGNEYLAFHVCNSPRNYVFYARLTFRLHFWHWVLSLKYSCLPKVINLSMWAEGCSRCLSICLLLHNPVTMITIQFQFNVNDVKPVTFKRFMIIHWRSKKSCLTKAWKSWVCHFVHPIGSHVLSLCVFCKLWSRKTVNQSVPVHSVLHL